MPYCACIPKPLYTGSIIAYGSCCVLNVAEKKRGTTWFHCLKQIWVQLAAGVRSQAGSRMLGALFREGYTHSPSRVESQVSKAFPICLPHFTVLYISHGLRKHTSCCVSWFSNPLALVKGGISGYLYPFIVTPTVPTHFIQWAPKFQVWVNNILILKAQTTILNFFVYCIEALRCHSYWILKFYWPSISPRLQVPVCKETVCSV